MSRKSYLILMSPTSFDPCKHVTKADFKYLPLGGFSLLFVGIRLVSWVHCRNPTSPHSALSLMSKWRPSSTRFTLRPRALARALRHLTGRTTATLFKFFPMDVCFFSAHSSCIARFDPKLFAGHRRGGASFDYWSGVPIEPIKALGDWCSNTILIYSTMPLTVRLHSANMLCKAILLHNPLHPHNNQHFHSFFSGLGPLV